MRFRLLVVVAMLAACGPRLPPPNSADSRYDGQQRAVLPAPWNARSRVHEYGGRAYLPVPGRPRDGQGGPAGLAVVFANYPDQRLYLVPGPGGDAGAEGGRADAGRAGGVPSADAWPADAGVPVPLTPAPAEDTQAALRFADFILSADGREIWCVQERHEAGKITRSLVAVPLDGSAAEDPAAIRELVSGPLRAG